MAARHQLQSFCQLFLLAMLSSAAKVDYGYLPAGDNPRLYDEVAEPIVQLDEDTFNDTVYRADTAFFIEFYADWCGYCRRFAPHFSQFAEEVRLWAPVMKVAVINCADSYNKGVCKDNNITMYPTNKYFPRGSAGAMDGIEIEDLDNHPETMTDEVANAVKDEYLRRRYSDWPNFEWLGKAGTYGELWSGVSNSVQHVAVAFDKSENSTDSIKLMLNASKYTKELAIRRCTPDNQLTDLMRLQSFPAVVVFKRNSASAAYGFKLDSGAYEKLENIATTGDPMRSIVTTTTRMTTTSTMAPWSCRLNPNRCAELYFVSETDMLKAMYNALYNDVPRAGGNFTGANLTALNNFMDLLATNFPTQQGISSRLRSGNQNATLKQSSLARQMFAELRDFLKSNVTNGSVTTRDWEHKFEELEEKYQMPFETNAKYEHCRGSTNQFRGYTCGLWTTFHALTIQAYLNNQNNASFQPLPVLQAIQGWVDHYFGCRNCRDHFMEMTTKTFPMETKVKKADDVFLYLWQAHNTVNARLKGENTEDPEFPKDQFPEQFLCNNCTSRSGIFDDRAVTNFLFNFYTTIKPYNPQDNAAARVTLPLK